jgi:hypothetical protein
LNSQDIKISPDCFDKKYDWEKNIVQAALTWQPPVKADSPSGAGMG